MANSVIVEHKGGQVVFRSRFLDFTGVYMVHCHMINHEEMGMMQTVEVYKAMKRKNDKEFDHDIRGETSLVCCRHRWLA